MSEAGKCWKDDGVKLTAIARKVLKYRIDNQFAWSHELREDFWDELCNLFPSDMLPKGRGDAHMESSLDYIARIDSVKVIAHGMEYVAHVNLTWAGSLTNLMMHRLFQQQICCLFLRALQNCT